jgi:ABC-type Fe3+/spermidine/putrescine transport system ATPase subunit
MALEAVGLKKSFAGFSVSLDIRVEEGETLALVGPSGSGKTTALNLIAGLAEQEAGKVIINGTDISGLPPWKRNISVVFQDLALFPHLDVGGNIAYGLFVRGVPRKERLRIAGEALETVRLPGFARRRIDTLSGGERQRVAIARALASKPAALLLDEPFSSLDAPLRKEMRRAFLDIRSGSAAPCVFVTHDREEAAVIGDRIAFMTGGTVTEAGPCKELFLEPKTGAAARFFGAGQVLPCVLSGTGAASGAGGAAAGWIEAASPLGNVVVSRGAEGGAESAGTSGDPPPGLFVPHDAVGFEEPAGGTRFKPCEAVCAGSFVEGRRVSLKLLLPPWQGAGGPVPFEASAGPRMKPPAPGGAITFWIDQSLLRFVR